MSGGGGWGLAQLVLPSAEAQLPPVPVLRVCTQADDVPDEAEEAGEGADMQLEGSGAIEPQQHAASEQQQADGTQP